MNKKHLIGLVPAVAAAAIGIGFKTQQTHVFGTNRHTSSLDSSDNSLEITQTEKCYLAIRPSISKVSFGRGTSSGRERNTVHEKAIKDLGYSLCLYDKVIPESADSTNPKPDLTKEYDYPTLKWCEADLGLDLAALPASDQVNSMSTSLSGTKVESTTRYWPGHQHHLKPRSRGRSEFIPKGKTAGASDSANKAKLAELKKELVEEIIPPAECRD